MFSLAASSHKDLLVTPRKEVILKFLTEDIGSVSYRNCTKNGVIVVGGIWVELNNLSLIHI